MMSNEINVSVIRAYSKHVSGCVRHKKDVMIAFTREKELGIVDLFLTQEQAISLMESLKDAIKLNDRDDEE